MIPMHEIGALLLALVTGALLGLLFFGGLWWTVQKGFAANQPALWFFGSLLLRTGTVVAGFYLVGRGQWERLLVCLVGFLIARLVVTLRLSSGQALRPGSGENPPQLPQESSHAS